MYGITSLSLSQPLNSAVEGGGVTHDGEQTLSRIGSNEVGCCVRTPMQVCVPDIIPHCILFAHHY